MGEISKPDEGAAVTEAFYKQAASILNAARNKAYAVVNFAMVEAYWEIGRSIVEEQGGEERAGYGEALLQGLAERLTADFGKGFDASNLRYMRQFYLAFPIRDALRHELSWTHYRRLSRICDADARTWYMNECAESHWSTRQIERQINTMFRERLLAPMVVYRREFGLRARSAHKSNIRRLSYEWLVGPREICINPVPAPLAYGELRLRGCLRDKDGTWMDEIPDGNDYSIDAVRYAVMEDVLCG